MVRRVQCQGQRQTYQNPGQELPAESAALAGWEVPAGRSPTALPAESAQCRGRDRGRGPDQYYSSQARGRGQNLTALSPVERSPAALPAESVALAGWEIPVERSPTALPAESAQCRGRDPNRDRDREPFPSQHRDRYPAPDPGQNRSRSPDPDQYYSSPGRPSPLRGRSPPQNLRLECLYPGRECSTQDRCLHCSSQSPVQEYSSQEPLPEHSMQNQSSVPYSFLLCTSLYSLR